MPRIRRLINVESGLNDGITTPFVSVALAGVATGGQVAEHGPAAAVAELAVGILAGVATAEPLATRYAKLLAHRAARGPGALMPDMPDRRLIRRSSPPQG
jgi:NhaP-type Na+/H+ or K+/H+ antiporter